MNKYLIIGLIFLLISSLIGWMFYKLAKYADKIYKELASLKAEAKKVQSLEEIQNVWKKLIQLDKQIWHRAFDSRKMEIKGILDTKYNLLIIK